MEAHIFDTAAVLMVLAAFFGYLNHRYLRLPFAIGLTVSALLASCGMLLFDWVFPQYALAARARHVMEAIDFTEALLHGMLSFLLFAGALHVDLEQLLGKVKTIFTLATVGVLLSAGIVGLASFQLFGWFGLNVPFLYCLVFGALIAPTDPVAVLGIVRAAGASPGHEVKVVGESLFNDGIGVVVFTMLLHVAAGVEGHTLGAAEMGGFFLREVVGGMLLGVGAGLIAYRAMRKLDEHNLEILISVALVMGVTFVAFRLHSSAPLACVTAGLLIGNHGRRLAMSDQTRDALDLVWGFFDEALNAVLFLLVGLEVLTIPMKSSYLLAAGLMVPVALIARYVSVALPIAGLRRFDEFTPGAVQVLTWGGLKGGISVALALSLPPFPGREAVLAATYAVVLFSIIVQGLTVGRLIKSVAVAERTS